MDKETRERLRQEWTTFSNSPPVVFGEITSDLLLASMYPTPIPVTERLPANGQEVLALWWDSEDSYWQQCMFIDGAWMTDVDECPELRRIDDDVTHWLPMPPAPNVAILD